MPRYNPDLHHRHSIRLREYDYSQAGAYFVTICTQNRECLFGEIRDERMVPNDAGQMIQSSWDELPQHYPGIDIDAFVAMPNHIHGIIVLVGAGPRACPGNGKLQKNKGHPQGGAPTLSLPDIVHRFKSLTTTRYKNGVAQNGWPPFPCKLWQRNYYEHIIRNEEELDRLREYIINNPAQWALDNENPECIEQNSKDFPKTGLRVYVGAGPCACPENVKPQEKGQPRGVAPTMGVLQYAPTKR